MARGHGQASRHLGRHLGAARRDIVESAIIKVSPRAAHLLPPRELQRPGAKVTATCSRRWLRS